MSSDWKQNLYEIGIAGGMALAALLFVAAVIRGDLPVRDGDLAVRAVRDRPDCGPRGLGGVLGKTPSACHTPM